MQNFPFMEARQALVTLKSSESGLTESEAQLRLGQYGKNSVEEKKRGGLALLFISQFGDFMTLLLIAAAVVSGIVAFVSRDRGDLTDTLIILAIIFLNAVVGTVQQFRADKAIANLKKLSMGAVKVRRGGKEREIPTENLTVGDVIIIGEGDVIPADCRILSCNGLKCDESALTGESLPVYKSAAAINKDRVELSEAANLLFCSTYAVGGNAEAVVYAVGKNTETGKIAGMLQGDKPSATPLEKTLNKLGKIISAIVLAITAAIFIFGAVFGTGGVLKNFMTAVAIAVAAIPEGLPAVVTIIMAMGVSRMSAKNVVIRKLKSVETLGGCTVICTDKTGTLTENKMRVLRVWGGFSAVERGAEGEVYRKILQCMTACTDVRGEKGAYIGDPTEIALKAYADECGFLQPFSKIDEIPFTSERKLMSVSADFAGEKLNLVKGAPDILSDRCAYVLTADGVRPLTPRDREEISRENTRMSRSALRVLGFAYCPYDGEMREEKLIFAGLCGMKDGLKKGVKQAVEQCRTAGIKTVMITGDSPQTALAIAQSLHIAEDMGEVVTGAELDAMPKAERDKAIRKSRVFARVSPKHKNMIVKCLKARGEVVAMTGDGINDAPAIKAADIGVAMGISGTDVTKSASDMVIADDNFATIVAAVREGRRISANIGKTIEFFLSTNLAEVLAILIAVFAFFGKSFLLSTQLLWLNLITDSFPVLALGMEREEKDIMSRPPVRAQKALFSKRSVASIAFFGAYITAVTIAVFSICLHIWGNQTATCVTFLTISFFELFHAFNVRSARNSAFSDFFGNKVLLLTVAAGIAINVALAFCPFASAFGLVKLNAAQWCIALFAPLSILPVGELFKLCLRLAEKRKKRL